MPKDGPSAGVTMYTALVSLFTGVPVRPDVAMTGEITLRGNVLQIGGVKEKLLAAHRAGIKRVIIPERNVKDLIDVPEEVKNEMEILSVQAHGRGPRARAEGSAAVDHRSGEGRQVEPDRDAGTRASTAVRAPGDVGSRVDVRLHDRERSRAAWTRRAP